MLFSSWRVFFLIAQLDKMALQLSRLALGYENVEVRKPAGVLNANSSERWRVIPLEIDEWEVERSGRFFDLLGD